MKLKQCIETSNFLGKADRCMLLKQKIQLRSVPFSSDMNISGWYPHEINVCLHFELDLGH